MFSIPTCIAVISFVQRRFLPSHFIYFSVKGIKNTEDHVLTYFCSIPPETIQSIWNNSIQCKYCCPIENLNKTFYSFPWPLLLNVKAKLHRTIPKKLYVWNRVFLLSFDDFDTFPHFKLSTRVSSYRTMWTFLPGNYKNMCLLFFMFSPSGKGRGKQSLPGRVCWLLQF